MVVSSAGKISVKCKYELPEGEPININYKCRFLPFDCVKQFPADWAGGKVGESWSWSGVAARGTLSSSPCSL